MFKNKRLSGLLLLTVLMLILPSCTGDSSSGSASNSATSSSLSSSSTSSSESSSGSLLDPETYEAGLSAWSQPNHFYIHYLRIVNTLEDYALWNTWVWQKAPNDVGGVAFEWAMQDQSGSIADIDLSLEAYSGVTRLGFLIVLKSSKLLGGSMWTSDGGTEMYIEDFPSHVRPDGSVHIFCQQGAVSDYTYAYEGNAATDPYANDHGSYVSVTNVTSSTSTFPTAITSQDFYNNVGIGYQIQVSSYADSDGNGFGDIKGITENLDYIEGLGVKALWLTPIQQSESYHGYDVTNYYAVDSKFGSITDYAELIYKAHQRGIRVLMDLVVNHTSTQNAWFQKSVNLKHGTDSAGNPIDYRSFYRWKYDETDSLLDPWHKFGETHYYYYGKFSTGMPELNYDYQGTRDAMVDVASYWLGFGLDGFRIDAVKHIYMKDEGVNAVGDSIVNDVDALSGTDYGSNRTKNVNFFKEFNYRLKSVYPDCFIVGENFDGWDARVAPYYEGMDSELDFQNYYHLVNATWNGIEAGSAQAESAVFAAKYGSSYVSTAGTYHMKHYRTQPINGAFTGNHDVGRAINHVMATKISTSETRDAQTVTTGNYSLALQKSQVYSATTLLQPGCSWIYYGDELGMTGNWTLNQDGSNWNKDRWFRQPFKWTTNTGDEKYAYNTGYSFDVYNVQWDSVNASTTVAGAVEQQLDNTSMYAMVKKIADYKNLHSGLINGTYTAISTGQSSIFAYKLVSSEGTYYIYCNYGANAASSGWNKGGTSIGVSWNGSSASNLPAYGWVVLK